MATRKITDYPTELPRGKKMLEIDAMRHGEWRDFTEESKATAFCNSTYDLASRYKRKLFPVRRQLPEGQFRVWILRY